MTDRAVAGDVRPLAAIAGELRRHGIAAVSPSGVLGDPSDATLGEGRDLLDTLTDDLVSAVDDALNTW
jgi:creatinine amidohydrolase